MNNNSLRMLHHYFVIEPLNGWKEETLLGHMFGVQREVEKRNRNVSQLAVHGFNPRKESFPAFESRFHSASLEALKKSLMQPPEHYKIVGTARNARAAFRRLPERHRDVIFCLFHNAPGKIPASLRGRVTELTYGRTTYDASVLFCLVGNLTPTELEAAQKNNDRFESIKKRAQKRLNEALDAYQALFLEEVANGN